MKSYRQLKRVWSRGSYTYIPGFRNAFPELDRLTHEELCDRFQKLNVDFFSEDVKYVSPWIRVTLPFALILLAIMLLSIPVLYMITGKWGYGFTQENRVLNWFRMLGLTH